MKHNCEKCGSYEFEMRPHDFLRGQRCPLCGKLLKNKNKSLSFNYLTEYYSKFGCTLLSTEECYKNNKSILTYKCKCGRTYSSSFIAFQLSHRCKICAIENNKRENHYNWKGGISPLHEHLRKHIYMWKKDSMNFFKCKCCLTNSQDVIVHHLFKNFSEIAEESLFELNLPIHNEINQYTGEELNLLNSKILELHYKYGLGIVINENIHKLFHSEYSYKNNTVKQFKEFITRLELGEFNDFLNENSLTLNIKHEILNKLLDK